MNTLDIVNESEITELDRKEIDEQIECVISRHKNNRYEINKLVFDSVSALTISENYSDELASQGVLKRFCGGITGKNKELQSKIDSNLRMAQYASQHTLQKLAEQNLMSFELITAVNNKLNSSIIEIETEINNIYGTLVTFFKKTKSDIVQLENRVERLERNVNLLNWQNSIEYQVWNGIEYADLDTVSKIVCIAKDFYDITKCEWRTSDLLLLKVALDTAGLSAKDVIVYSEFVEAIHKNKELKQHLFENLQLEVVENYPEIMLLSSMIRKREVLDFQEKYIVSSVLNIIDKFDSNSSENIIKHELLKEYEIHRNQFNINAYVNVYELILELLYNLSMINQFSKLDGEIVEGEDEELESFDNGEDNKKLRELYSEYKIEEVTNIAHQLMEKKSNLAPYVLGLIYEQGHADLCRDTQKAQRLFEQSYQSGYLPALVRLVLPLVGTGNIEKGILKEKFTEIEQLANMGDEFAALECARCYVNYKMLFDEENQYEKAVSMFKKAPKGPGLYGLAIRYDNGQGVLKDYKQSFECYFKSAEVGFPPAEYEVAKAYENGWGCDVDKEKAFQYYLKAESHGHSSAIGQVGSCYLEGLGVRRNENKAFQYFLLGADKGIEYCMYKVAECYRTGKGVDFDKDKALEWYKKTAEIEKDGWASYWIGRMSEEWLDHATAGRYYRKSMDMGNEWAINELNSGGKLMISAGFSSMEEFNNYRSKIKIKVHM